jgi:hypothetical protein
VNPLGEHRPQGSRIATIIAFSSMERTVDLASLRRSCCAMPRAISYWYRGLWKTRNRLNISYLLNLKLHEQL